MKIASAFVIVISASALAEEAKKAPGPEEQAMMEKYVKAATPGPEHQKLAKMAGNWKLQVTMWMAPGAPPQKSDGTAEFRPILGGRYVEEQVHGSMGDQPFEGRGVQGFDNVTKQHFGTWMDSMSTGPMVMRGKCAADGKKCAMKGKVSDAIAGKEVPVTSLMTAKDDNTYVFEMTAPGPDGKQFKTLEIVYTRAQ